MAARHPTSSVTARMVAADPPGWQLPHVNSPYGKSGNRWNSLADPHGDRL
jgi:hypothetical protein